MLDDIRNHDARMTREEEEWLRTDPLQVVLKALGLAAVAIAIGTAVSELVVPAGASVPPVVAQGR
jgi:hypothetical protein